MSKMRKNKAPKDEGEMPLEDRCPNCWKVLSLHESSPGTLVKWCINCFFVKRIKE